MTSLLPDKGILIREASFGERQQCEFAMLAINIYVLSREGAISRECPLKRGSLHFKLPKYNFVKLSLCVTANLQGNLRD